jgi:hypothetical protein
MNFRFSRIIFCMTFDPRNEAVRDTLNFCFFHGCVIGMNVLTFSKKMMEEGGRELFLKINNCFHAFETGFAVQ